MSVNKVILVGNVGKDPEVRYLEKDVAVANFTLATTDRAITLQNGTQVPERTEWHNIVFWGPIVDVIERYLKKGSQIYVEGKIRSRSYDDKDGIKRYATDIVGDTMTMLGGKPNSENSGGSSTSNASSSSPSSPAMESAGSFEPQTSGADDLPF